MRQHDFFRTLLMKQTPFEKDASFLPNCTSSSASCDAPVPSGSDSFAHPLEPIPASIWMIGFAMLLLNISATMVFCFAALFLGETLGVRTLWIGFVEGLTEGGAYATRLFSGVISDFLRRRKSVILIGYAMATLGRPILGLATSMSHVLFSRFLDRVGNGIQATPRDALIGDLAPPSRKGSCYGLKQAIGTAGSCIGGLVAMFVISWVGGSYRTVFLLAGIPALCAFLIVLFGIREPEENLHPKDKRKRHPIRWSDLGRLGGKYWGVMLIATIFMLARIGEPFLLMLARKNFGFQESSIPLILITYNLTYSLSSYPVGRLADLLNQRTLLAVGIFVLIVTDFILGTATTLPMMILGVSLWGVQMGIAQSIFSALVAELVPADLRGTGFGIFYLLSAVSVLCAGMAAGRIAELYGMSSAFLASGVIATISLLVLIIQSRVEKSW